MVTRLKAVDPSATEPSRPKILIFGRPGVGKTWASLDFPNVYYIDSEGGADLKHYTDKLKASGGAYMGQKQGAGDFEEVIEQVKALGTEKHTYKTLVIDSISKLYGSEIAREAERLGEKDQYGASKKPAVGRTRRLINWIDRLDMNVILIAHEKSLWANDKQTGVTFDAYDKLEHELHLCLNIFQAGPERMARVVKTRFTEFPPASVMPWSYAEFAKRFGEKKLNKSVDAIVLATPEQLSELIHLSQTVKVKEGWLEQCLTKAGADTIEELGTDQAKKMIDTLKSTLTKGAA